MRISHAFCSALLGTVVLATPTPAAESRADDDGTPIVPTAVAAAAEPSPESEFVPGAYIVELDDDEDSGSFYRTLADEDGIEVEHRMDLGSRLFKGASFRVRDAAADHDHERQEQLLAQIKAKPRVKNAWPVRIVKLKEPTLSSGGQASSVPLNLGNPRTTLRERREGEKDTFSPHVATQVDRLRAEGITGKGVRIAIVDSGVDWRHPALGGCFGPGCLVEAGYDFVGDDFLPPATPQPDGDPYDDCVGHGTHVAGIIAAQPLGEGSGLGFTGAAPGVKLRAYRAWGCRATATTEILIQAFVRAFEDGADIISCSDGDSSGWADDAWGLVASRIVEAGVPVVISEGNDGFAGLFLPSTPATGRGVTGVGAATNTHYPVLFSAAAYTVGDDSDDASAQEFGFLRGYPQFTSEVKLPLWPAGNDTASTSDACSPLPDDTPDLSDRIVLLRVPANRDCYPNDQGANVAAKGGRYLMYYAQDNLTIDEQFVYSDGIQAVAMVAPYQGARWIDLLNRGETVTVSMPNPNTTSTRLEQLENNVSGGYMADFTSWGPTWELAVTPQLAAPGANILSTYLLNQGGYRVMSGTSMSCPLVAAIYALVAEARGGGPIDPSLFRSLLSATSKPQVWFDREEAYEDVIAPVAQQGAGIVQAWDAAHAPAVLSVDALSFNDSDHFIGEHTFSVRNAGSKHDVEFVLGYESAATMYTFIPGADVLRAKAFPNPIVEGEATITFSSDTITIPAGGSADVTVTATPPTGLNATLLPVYSGYITLTSSSTKKEKKKTTVLRLPYLGVVGSLKSTPVLQPARVYLADYNLPVEANRTYALPRPDPAAPPRDDLATQPNALVGLTVGTRMLRVDVVALGRNSSSPLPEGQIVGGVETVGSLLGYPLPFAPRDEKRAFFKGLLADGTVLPAGSYKLLVSALRVFGDAGREEDWDFVETVPFNVEYV